MSIPDTSPFLNNAGHASSSAVSEEIREAVLERYASGIPGAVIADAPAGGGKTFFVIDTICKLTTRGQQLMVVTPTNEQVRSLLKRLVKKLGSVDLLHAKGMESDLPGVNNYDTLLAIPADSPVIVSTVAKLGLSLCSNNDTFDPQEYTQGRVLIVDEAYQVPSSDYLRVAGNFTTHLLVGDPGQLSPFTTLGDVTSWRGRPEDPTLSAVDVLLMNHPDSTQVFHFPITRRLPHSAVPLVRRFYAGWEAAGMELSSWALPQARELKMDGEVHPGWEYHQLPLPSAELAANITMAKAIAARVAQMLGNTTYVDHVKHEEPQPLTAGDVMVGVSRNEQRLMVERELRRAGVDVGPGGVRVLTANKAQGLECQVMVVWHPLSGGQDHSLFQLEAGRLCVLLTRHKQACVVFGSDADLTPFEGPPPPRPDHTGSPDAYLRGWYLHAGLLRELEAFSVR